MLQGAATLWLSPAQPCVPRSNDTCNGVTTSGVVAFSGEQLDHFKEPDGTFLKEIPSVELEQAIGIGQSPSRTRKPPLALTCRPPVSNSPACKSLREEGSEGCGPCNDSQGSRRNHRPRKTVPQTDLLIPVTNSDVIALIQLLLKDMVSPEAAVAFGLEQTEQMSVTLRAEWRPSKKELRRRCMVDLPMQMLFSIFTTSVGVSARLAGTI